jgi:zinc transporter ZupT
VKPITISLIVFACVFAGAVAGMILRMILPERHFDPDAKDMIKLCLGLITTMNALVLGLMISTAKSSYDTKRTLVGETASDLILADRSLALYGAETKEARSALVELVASLIEQIQSLRGNLPKSQSSELKAGAADFYQIVRKLLPRSDEQRALKAEVLRISIEVAQIRATALTQQATSIPGLFLVVLTFWLAILFIGFGLFAPPNPTVLATLCICAFSVAAAVFVVIEMDEAFTGVMRISSEPIRNAMTVIGR